jgi:hypothetical protein
MRPAVRLLRLVAVQQRWPGPVRAGSGRDDAKPRQTVACDGGIGRRGRRALTPPGRQAGAGELPGQHTRPVISSYEPAQAGQPLGALRRGWLRGGRWLLPWLAVLLVSASLASAMTKALTGAWVPITARSAPSPAPAVAELPPTAAVGDGADAWALDLACIARVGSYTASLSDAARRCSTLAGASATIPLDERGDARCEFIVGQPLYAGQNSRAPQRGWQCPTPLP